MLRCQHCNGTIKNVPDSEDGFIPCPYCGTSFFVQQVLDRARARATAKAAAARLEHERANVAADHVARIEEAKARRPRAITRLIGIVPFLIGPIILAVVFDVPARFGYGDAGQRRLEPIVTQLKAKGCTQVGAVKAEFVSGSVGASANSGCIVVVAAGGPRHRTLTVRILADGTRELATVSNVTPLAQACGDGALRYEVLTGPATAGL